MLGNRSLTIDQLIDGWQRHLQVRNLEETTRSTYAYYLAPFLEFLQPKQLDPRDITFRALEAWILHLRKLESADRTIGLSISSIKSFYKWLKREEHIDHNPCADLESIRIDKPIPKVATESHVEQLIEASTKPAGRHVAILLARDLAIFETLYATGIRRKSLCWIDVLDLNLEGERPNVRIRKAKGRKQKVHPLGRKAVEAIKGWLPTRQELLGKHGREEERALFITIKARRMLGGDIYRVVKKAETTTGLESFPHLLRHSFATHLLNRGANLKEVQELLNHADLQTTGVYTHVATDQLSDVIKDIHPRG